MGALTEVTVHTTRGCLSVVVPAYNEESNIDRVYERLCERSRRIGLEWELIFSVDPSTDRTEQKILELRAHDPRVKMLRFSRRFGQPMATLAGMEAAVGDAVVVIDCDLQDPPELIPDLVAALARRTRRRLRPAPHARRRDAAEAHRLGARLPADRTNRRSRDSAEHRGLPPDEPARR